MALMVVTWLFSVWTQLLLATSWLLTTPISVCGISYTSKNYLKWWAIQLVIHSTVDTWINYGQGRGMHLPNKNALLAKLYQTDATSIMG